MKQTILRKLILIAVLLTSSYVFAHDFEVKGIYYKILSEDDKTITVTYKGSSYSEYSNEYTGDIVIPQTVTYNNNIYSVASIDDYTFYDCSSFTSITIPSSVSSIGEYAFSVCISLTSITIPNSVISIGDGAFFRCYSLTSITIPDSVTSIGDYTFYDCSSLASTTIPSSVTSIGDYAFGYCISLTSITIPNSVTSIGGGAFNFTGLTSISIPNSVTNIGDDAFGSCSSLSTISVESGNTTYDSRDNCNAIIETASNKLIAGCKNTIIPSAVTSIGDYIFYDCIGLTTITIPKSVISIGDEAFAYCTGLTEIICENSIPPTAYVDTFTDVTATLYVPVGSKDAYASATGWSTFSNIIEDDVKTGVESTLADNNVNVSVVNGNVVVTGVTDKVNVEVYSVNGQCVYNGNATTIPVTVKGIYIVKVNNKTFKVIL